MNADMCACGIVWLPGYLDAFPAEGRMHMRTGCDRIERGPITFPLDEASLAALNEPHMGTRRYIDPSPAPDPSG